MAVYLYLYFYKMYVLFFGGAQKCSYVPKGGPPEKVWVHPLFPEHSSEIPPKSFDTTPIHIHCDYSCLNQQAEEQLSMQRC